MNSEILLKKADYVYWNMISMITWHEFIHLAAGFEPRPISRFWDGCHTDLNNSSFYKNHDRMLRFQEELQSTTNDIEVLIEDGRQTKYKAMSLVKWARSKKIPINKGYKPKINIDKGKKQIKDDPRKIVSLEKIALGLAKELGYDPYAPKNALTGTNKNSISSVLKGHGLKLTDDTIRERLKEAAENHLKTK